MAIPIEATAQMPSFPTTACNLFMSPTTAFQALRDKPASWPWLLLSSAIAIAASNFVVWRVGYARIISDALANLSVVDAKSYMENAIRNEPRILAIQGVSTMMGTWIMIYCVAIVLWLIMMVADSRGTFKQTLTVVAAVTFIVYSVKYTLVASVAAINPEALNINNPLATSLGYFLNSDNPHLQRAYQACDALSFLGVFLAARGLHIISVGKLRFPVVLGVVGSLWLLYAAIKVWSPWA